MFKVIYSCQLDSFSLYSIGLIHQANHITRKPCICQYHKARTQYQQDKKKSRSETKMKKKKCGKINNAIATATKSTNCHVRCVRMVFSMRKSVFLLSSCTRMHAPVKSKFNFNFQRFRIPFAIALRNRFHSSTIRCT